LEGKKKVWKRLIPLGAKKAIKKKPNSVLYVGQDRRGSPLPNRGEKGVLEAKRGSLYRINSTKTGNTGARGKKKRQDAGGEDDDGQKEEGFANSQTTPENRQKKP